MRSEVALASSVGHAQQPFRIIIAQTDTPLVPASIMILADELGYFAAEGIDVELVKVTDTPLAVDALQAGEGDMANISTDSALLLVANGTLDLRAVNSPNKFLPFLIACRDDVASIADMAGRSFGVARIGSLDHTLSSMVMTTNGLDPADVSFVAIGAPAARGEALAAGQIECTSMSIGTWLSIPDRTGLEVLVPVAEFGDAAPVVNQVNVVTADTLANRRGDVEAVTRALIKISRDFNANPQDWVNAMLVSRPDQTEENLAVLAGAFVGAWSVNGGLNATELAVTVEQVFAGADFAGLTPPALEQWVDFSVVDDILTDLGVDDTADAPAR